MAIGSFLEDILSQAYAWGPWVFSMCNRDPASPEYGCFDRCYWQYRTEREFPAATFQYLVLSLACLYLDTGSPWYGNPELKEWAGAGCRFWARMQRHDGSFDEWLPYEQSHVATAFSMAMISEALILFREAGDPLDPGVYFWQALEKAGRWLTCHHDNLVLNHTAGAVAALGNLHVLTNEKGWRKGSQRALDVLAAAQTPEGWFPEYGGADPGYTSVSIDFLVKYWRRSQDERALAMLERALSFFVHFVNPDGTVGGIHGSRNTRYLLPHGLLIMAERLDVLKALLRWCDAQRERRGITLNALDDRYRGFFLPNHLQALLDLHALPGMVPQFPEKETDTAEVFFPEAGLLKTIRGKFTLFCNLKKLGVFELFHDGTFLHANGGYDIIFTDGSLATTQWLDPVSRGMWNTEEGIIETAGRLARVKSPGFFHSAMLPHRIFSHILGAVGFGGDTINSRIKNLFVKPRIAVPARFHRQLTLTTSGMEVRDNLTWDRPASSVIINKGWGRMHVPSSNFYDSSHNGHERIDVRGKQSLTIITAIGPQGYTRGFHESRIDSPPH